MAPRNPPEQLQPARQALKIINEAPDPAIEAPEPDIEVDEPPFPLENHIEESVSEESGVDSDENEELQLVPDPPMPAVDIPMRPQATVPHLVPVPPHRWGMGGMEEPQRAEHAPLPRPAPQRAELSRGFRPIQYSQGAQVIPWEFAEGQGLYHAPPIYMAQPAIGPPLLVEAAGPIGGVQRFRAIMIGNRLVPTGILMSGPC